MLGHFIILNSQLLDWIDHIKNCIHMMGRHSSYFTLKNVTWEASLMNILIFMVCEVDEPDSLIKINSFLLLGSSYYSSLCGSTVNLFIHIPPSLLTLTILSCCLDNTNSLMTFLPSFITHMLPLTPTRCSDTLKCLSKWQNLLNKLPRF